MPGDKQHRESYREHQQNPSGDSPFLDNTNISYFNGQILPQAKGGYPAVDNTMDRASIASHTGFPPLNINDITGITRGGEVTVVNDPNAYPPVSGSVDRFYPSSGASPSPGAPGGGFSAFHAGGHPSQPRHDDGVGTLRDNELVMMQSDDMRPPEQQHYMQHHQQR